MITYRDGLKQFTVGVDWHEQKSPESIMVIARDGEDAKAIAMTLFLEGRTTACRVDAVWIKEPKP